MQGSRGVDLGSEASVTSTLTIKTTSPLNVVHSVLMYPTVPPLFVIHPASYNYEFCNKSMCVDLFLESRLFVHL